VGAEHGAGDVAVAAEDVDYAGGEAGFLDEMGYSGRLCIALVCNQLIGGRPSNQFDLTVSGAFSLLFNTTALPAANAGATLLAKKSSGTFHGIIAATTPNGCLKVIPTHPGVLSVEVPCTS